MAASPYTTHEDFFLKTPLYEPKIVDIPTIKTFIWKKISFDGYCPFCDKETTFDRHSTGGELSGAGIALQRE